MRKYILCNDKGAYCRIEVPRKASSDWWNAMYAKFERQHGGQAWTMHLYDDQMSAGLYYNYDLCMNGMLACFIVFPETTKEQVQEAKRELRRNHDVVRISCERLKRKVQFDLPEEVTTMN